MGLVSPQFSTFKVHPNGLIRSRDNRGKDERIDGQMDKVVTIGHHSPSVGKMPKNQKTSEVKVEMNDLLGFFI